MTSSPDFSINPSTDFQSGELRLYVAGATPNSLEAQRNLARALQTLGDDAADLVLEIFDVSEVPERALVDGVVVTPTLIGTRVSGRLTLVGNLMDASKLDLFLQSLLDGMAIEKSKKVIAMKDHLLADAEQASQAKSRFLTGMSHELRTPLNGILGYAHLLHMEGGLNHTQNARVDAMLEAGNHLLGMINTVLDLAKIEAERFEMKAVEIDIEAVSASCLDLVRPMAQSKGLALDLVVHPQTPPALITDPTRLRQILVNLLGNAVKFTHKGGIALHMRCSADGSALRFEVVDTGPGLSAEQHERLFQDFERLGIEATSDVEGAGLGLALSVRLATLMGGRMGHHDNAGGGSIFWLELPLDVVDAAAMVQVFDSSNEELTSELALRVLVVDDIAMNRDIALSFLQAEGYEVTCAENGAAAIAAATSMDFDAILMDVRMPQMDGLEATRRIRTIDGVRGRVPIVAVTAQVFTEQIAECHRAGMNSHVAKPFDPVALSTAVNQAINAVRHGR